MDILVLFCFLTFGGEAFFHLPQVSSWQITEEQNKWKEKVGPTVYAVASPLRTLTQAGEPSS